MDKFTLCNSPDGVYRYMCVISNLKGEIVDLRDVVDKLNDYYMVDQRNMNQSHEIGLLHEYIRELRDKLCVASTALKEFARLEYTGTLDDKELASRTLRVLGYRKQEDDD